MRRICCFCETWESGGIESFLCNMLARMDLDDLEIDLVVAQQKDSVFTERLREHGVNFYELSGSQKRIAKNHRLFRKLLQERHYDVLYLNIFQGMSLCYAHIAKQIGVPVRIAHSHNTDLRESITRKIKLKLHHFFSRQYSADATEFWACSKKAAEFMFPEELLKERGFTFIQNGIDTEKFRFNSEHREAVRQELGFSDKFVVGNVGRLCFQKNQTFLLDVFSKYHTEAPDSVLLLVGDGDDREALEKKAESLGIADHVVFYGVSKQVEQLFWAMDVCAFPSKFEGLGIVAIEAQAAGLPVLCSENVPEEACVTGGFKPVSLQEGVPAWIDALNACKKENLSREAAFIEVQKAGFEVKEVAQRLQNNFKGI